MTCDKIKELILTDYLDNEVNDEERVHLAIHFSRCPGCKDFLETAKNKVIKPFTNVKSIEPPEFIWYRVKEAIVAEQQEGLGFVGGILKNLKSHYYIPRQVLAMSTVMVLALIVVIMATLKFSSREVLQEDQAEYSMYSIDAPVSAILSNEEGLGTSVEQYFL